MCSLNKSHAHIHYIIKPAECKPFFRAFRIFFGSPHTGGSAGLCKIRVQSVSLV